MTYSAEYNELVSESTLDAAKIAYYDAAVDPAGLTARAASVTASEAYQTFCADLAEATDEDPRAFSEAMQDAVEYQSAQYYTLGELMGAAPLSQQRGLQASVLSKLIADPHTGIAVNPLLLRDPEVIVLPDGTLRLLGGNHRVALVYSMLITGGKSEDDALATQLRCIQCSVNLGVIKDKLTTYDENDEPVLPADADVLKSAYRIAFLLWIASNQSRSMTATEIKDAASHASGVDRTSESAILDATFGDTPLINHADACRMLARLHVVRHQAVLTTESGAPIIDPTVVPCQFTIGALKLNTFEAIIASAYAAIMKVSQDVAKTNAKTGEVKSHAHKVWAKDGKDVRGLTRLADLLAANADTAISEHMGSLPDNDTYKGNVARNAAKIGAVLAELVDASFEPMYPYVAPVAKAKASKVKARSALTLGL